MKKKSTPVRTRRGKGRVRTSASDPIEVAWLLDERPRTIGITFAPGKHGSSKSGARWERDLAADLDELVQRHGMGIQVCLLEDDELARLRIPTLVAKAERRGVEVLRLLIPDGGVLQSGAGRAARRPRASATSKNGATSFRIGCLGGSPGTLLEQ